MKLEFARKLLCKYFLYGYLCILGAVISFFLVIEILKECSFPVNLVSVPLSVSGIALTAQLGRIIFSTKYKFKYYKISKYRLATRGYKDSYFECEMAEPCFRLIIKDLLYENGYSKEYKILRDKCRGRNVRVEKAKERLLERVKKEHEKASIVI